MGLPSGRQYGEHRILARIRPESVQKVYRKCTENVQKMFRKCSENVQKMFRKCSENVQKMFRN
jgi:hypothetical protein